MDQWLGSRPVVGQWAGGWSVGRWLAGGSVVGQ